MKIKLAILENDLSYLQRIVSVFETKYADKFEVYSFTDPDVAIVGLEDSKIDVFIANDIFEINTDSLPKRCGFAYFVDSSGVTVIKNHQAICKFQKVEQIYKQILSLYSETANNIIGVKLDGGATKIIMFASPAGGAGASVMTAACAAHFAAAGKRTLYLNLEKFGSSDIFFSGEGQFDMSDIIYTLKSKKSNLCLKLESTVKHDISGVYFYSQPKVALDMLELKSDELIQLLSELKLTGSYDFIIIDTDFALTKEALKLYQEAHRIVWVGDGSQISNRKIHRAYDSLSIMEQKSDSPLVNRISLIYNKFGSKTGKQIDDFGLKSIGGAPRYEHANAVQVVSQLAAMDMFDKIIL